MTASRKLSTSFSVASFLAVNFTQPHRMGYRSRQGNVTIEPGIPRAQFQLNFLHCNRSSSSRSPSRSEVLANIYLAQLLTPQARSCSDEDERGSNASYPVRNQISLVKPVKRFVKNCFLPVAPMQCPSLPISVYANQYESEGDACARVRSRVEVGIAAVFASTHCGRCVQFLRRRIRVFKQISSEKYQICAAGISAICAFHRRRVGMRCAPSDLRSLIDTRLHIPIVVEGERNFLRRGIRIFKQICSEKCQICAAGMSAICASHLIGVGIRCASSELRSLISQPRIPVISVDPSASTAIEYSQPTALKSNPQVPS